MFRTGVDIIDTDESTLNSFLHSIKRSVNHRASEERILGHFMEALMSDGNLIAYVVIALDVNGLKTINDTLGHKACDELIIGASKCINQSFASVGKSYRTGGDEFMAIVRCDRERLQTILAEFDSAVSEWKGTLVERLSISYGYAMAKEHPGLSVRELASEADKRMYEKKAAYYRQAGIERRNRGNITKKEE